MARSYQHRDIKLLWGLSAARCAFTNCRLECVESANNQDRAVVLGKIAHMVGHSDDGPRGDPSFPKEHRNKYENLLLLCGPHHDVVDGQTSTYTVQQLRDMKAKHELWVRENLALEMPRVGFAELEIITQAIVAPPATPTIRFVVIPPTQKLQRNGLTHATHLLVTMGLAKAKEVEQFVKHVATLHAEFPERLKAGFVAEYTGRRASGLDGDALFQAILDFANRGKRDFISKAAGLAVVAYLFERCEVFES